VRRPLSEKRRHKPLAITDTLYGVTFEPQIMVSAGSPLNASFSTAAEVVLSARYSVIGMVSVTGPAHELDYWRVGFVQNVVADSAIAYYGAFGHGCSIERVLKTGLRFPIRDARTGLGIWHSATAGGTVDPPTTQPAGGGASYRGWKTTLMDQPDVSFEWEVEDRNLSGIRGSTTFTYWLVATRGDFTTSALGIVPFRVLGSGSWQVIWASEVVDIDADPPRTRIAPMDGSGSSTYQMTAGTPKYLGPDINGNHELKIAEW
jgi:hypothetical protein